MIVFSADNVDTGSGEKETLIAPVTASDKINSWWTCLSRKNRSHKFNCLFFNRAASFKTYLMMI